VRKGALLLGILLLALTACGQPADEASAPGTTTPAGPVAEGTSPSSPASSQPGSGGTDLQLTAPAVLGGEVDLSDYAGKDLALWFWAPW
jgi:hypothetical protein